MEIGGIPPPNQSPKLLLEREKGKTQIREKPRGEKAPKAPGLGLVLSPGDLGDEKRDQLEPLSAGRAGGSWKCPAFCFCLASSIPLR